MCAIREAPAAANGIAILGGARREIVNELGFFQVGVRAAKGCEDRGRGKFAESQGLSPKRRAS